MAESWNMPQWKEPSLDELFSEPMIQQLMRRDGVHARDMQYQLRRAGSRGQSMRGRF